MPALKKVFETVEIRVINEPIVKPVPKIAKILNHMFREKVKINSRKPKFNKFLRLLVVLVFLLVQLSSPYAILAEEFPTPPEPPTAPVAPDSPTPPTPPEHDFEVPTAPTPPEPPSPPKPPSYNYKPPSPPKAPTPPSPPQNPYSDKGNEDSETVGSNSQLTDVGEGSGNIGDTTINTGDSTSSSNILTDGNSNLLKEGDSSYGSGSVIITNSQNGALSDNSGSVSVANTSATNQQNSVQIANDVNQSSITGRNTTSYNVGDSSISTGDANTNATVITSVNTNIDGVSVAEFNVVDDHVGDLVLDFGANCVSGCATNNVTLTNDSNSAFSTNSLDTSINNNSTTNQSNNANVGSDLTLVSDSGNNTASFNTGGDSVISTGDASVSANLLTLINNNLSGNFVLGVVNIFGDLIGDIVLTEEALASFCPSCLGDVSVVNSGNASQSTNRGEVDVTSNNDVSQFNIANIDNNLVLNANTGNNSASFNTDGDSSITTGEANVVASILNIANTNLNGGVWWLVLVNEAGKWIGKIIGADGQNYGGSEGLAFDVNENGDIYVANDNNGAFSNNSNDVNLVNNEVVNQTNSASVTNNLNITANTGGNKTSFNTGGNSSIKTGDANIIVNIVNFVNNNIVGGKLFVTVVNVFGTWIGDFLGPGMTKEKNSDDSSGIGGLAEQIQVEKNVNGSASDSNSTSSFDSDTSKVNQLTSSDSDGVVASYLTKYDKNKIAFLSSNQEGSGTTNQTLIASANDDFGNGTQAKKVIKINLAWSLLLLPLLGVYLIQKRKAGKFALNRSVNK